jgi:prepilin-type N-terminal cleavage/methylation domain-containing protein
MSVARPKRGVERGFTIVEVMIAIVILGIGILTVVAAFASAVATTEYAQENLIARQKALEALESIFTARNTQQITFSQIANLPSGGIFVSGAVPLWSAGNDGLINTADDLPFPAQSVCPAGPECITLPGPDGILGTTDDVAMSLGNFRRQIQINPVLQSDGSVNPNLKQVIVTVSYTYSSTVPRSYSVTALISAYR